MFFSNVMQIGDLEPLVTMGEIQTRRDCGKQEQMLDGLTSVFNKKIDVRAD
uniref:Uncharacterized protein n=1 Tax=Arion vulgaris TaxID=1028688 RepID=A0A0B7BCM8_9EUPU